MHNNYLIFGSDFMAIKSRRGLIKIVSFICAAFVALSAAAISGYVRAENLERININSQQRALTELTTCMSNIQQGLSKEFYTATAPMAEKLSSEIWREAAQAKSCLSVLPVSDILLENTFKFLSQVGAFCSSLSEKAASGEKISEEEYKSLEELIKYSKELTSRLENMCAYLENGALTFESTDEAVAAMGREMDSMNFETAISDAEQALVDYPTLIYDGPFSDHILQKEPEMLKGKEEVSEAAAAEAAANYSGIPVEKLKRGEDENGSLASYTFSSEEDGVVISITKKGGYLSYILGSSYAGVSKLSAEEAIERGLKYLESHGISNMKESYYSINDGICTVNFAYVQDGVICYPDLIKVSVAMDTGKIISFDARGYLVNHFARSDVNPLLTAENAKKSLSPYLTVKDTKTAVIPTDSGSEVLCYEFWCEGTGNEELLVYINAVTGEEENIFFLLYSDNGILVR